MEKPYALRSREEGRGRPSTTRFATLAEAGRFVREHWQGADYVDGPAAFHTDYASWELVGFTLKDLGTFGITGDGCRTFAFHADPAAEACGPVPFDDDRIYCPRCGAHVGADDRCAECGFTMPAPDPSP